MKDKKVTLSTLWVFLIFNYLYCDVLTLTDPVKQSGPQLTQGFLLGASILMEIPIVMVILSRILKYRINRWANIIAGTIMVAVQILTLFIGIPTIYYVFFSAIEIACASFIIRYAWKWPRKESIDEK
jgi:MFS family permease